MFSFKNTQVVTDNKTNKSFKYTKGDVTLSFTLRVDIKTELKDFLECLKVATAEIENELKQ
jgi:hypothetical protein